jgi:hypothetical protein
VPAPVKARIDDWLEAAGIGKGKIFRPVNKGGRITGESIADEKAVWQMVLKYARATSLGKLSPHDLRRYAVSRIMPNRNLRPPEYWVILDRKGERIRHYRGPSNWRNLSLGRHRRLGDAQEGLESMIARMPSSVAGSVLV